MSQSLFRINQVKNLISSSENNCAENTISLAAKAKTLICILNFYHCSPVFLICGGSKLQKTLADKFYVSTKKTLRDYLIGIPTAIFCDEIFIATAVIIISFLFCIFSLQPIQITFSNKGYNSIYSYEKASRIANRGYFNCCTLCNQTISCKEFQSEKGLKIYSCWFDSNKSANQTFCLDVSLSLSAVFNSLIKNITTFSIDNNSTYDVYNYIENKWHVVSCNKTIQANLESQNATIVWTFGIIFIFVWVGFFYALMIKLIDKWHKKLAKQSVNKIEKY